MLQITFTPLLLLYSNLPSSRGPANHKAESRNAIHMFVVVSLARGNRGLDVESWLLVPKFVGSNPAEAVRIFKSEKIHSTPSFGGEVKPAVPCRRFAACKRPLNGPWKSVFRQNYRILFSPINFHLSLLGSLASPMMWRHLAATVGTSKTREGNRVVQQA
jgi:hypothetical protein